MATALLQSPAWTAPELAPNPRLGPRNRRPAQTAPLPPLVNHQTAPLAPLEVAEIAPALRPTRFLTLLFFFLGAVTVALYTHTVRVEGDANQECTEIRKLKESNHFLQVKLAQATNLQRVEVEATSNLKMKPVEGGVFMELPNEVADMANTVIIPGREPSPVPLLPGI